MVASCGEALEINAARLAAVLPTDPVVADVYLRRYFTTAAIPELTRSLR